MARILIIGADGQVGWELQRSMAALGEVVTAGPSLADHTLVLADAEYIQSLFEQLQPVLVINSGDYSAVDHAETYSDLAWAVLMFAWAEDMALLTGVDAVTDGGAARRNFTRLLSAYAGPEAAGDGLGS